jgi:hypothetical protein
MLLYEGLLIHKKNFDLDIKLRNNRGELWMI